MKILAQCVNTPKILSHDTKENKLMLEYIEFKNDIVSEDYYNLGIELSKIHNLTCTLDYTYVANIRVDTSTYTNWTNCIKYRLKCILDKLYEIDTISYDYWKNGTKLYDVCHKYLVDDVHCCTLHGDANRGNWGVSKNNKIYLFDPTIFYGAHEYDIASLMLFDKNFDLKSFSRGYKYNLRDGWEIRFILYNFIHYVSSYLITKNKGLLNKGNSLIKPLISAELHFPSLIPYIFDKQTPILILFGTFNPIHNGHLQAFNDAIEILGKEKQYGGYIIASSDSKAREKLKKQAISFKKRINMIKLAIEYAIVTRDFPIKLSHCLITSDEEVKLDEKFVKHFGSIVHICNYYSNVYVVCGNDTYDFSLRHLENKVKQVIYTQRNEKICSTLIRNYIRAGNSTKALKLMSSEVYDYYVKN